MAKNGEEKLKAVVRHIAKTLGRTKNMADEIIHILTNFDDRFSSKKLSDSSNNFAADDDSSVDQTFAPSTARSPTSSSFDRPIWSDSDFAMAFLTAVNTLLCLCQI